MNMDRSTLLFVLNQKNITVMEYNAGSVFIGNFTPESAGDYAYKSYLTYKRLRKEL
jgi:hypothetical protein